jgi:NitT/TauT family transport system substrate-binding protein
MLAAVAVIAMAGCSTSGGSSAASSNSAGSTEVTLKVGTQTANPGELYKYVAQQLGEFKKYNLNVQMVSIANSATQTQALQSGSLDIAMSTIATVLAAPKALNLRVVAGSIAADPAILGDASIKTVQDLVGKNIGVAVLGPGPQEVVEALLKDDGVDPSKVNFVAYGSPTTRAAEMSSGKLQAAYVASSQAAQFISQSSVPLHIVAQSTPSQTNITNAFYPNLDVTSSAIESSKGTAIKSYCSAIINTINWMKNPANKNQLVSYVMKWEGIKSASQAYTEAVAPALPGLLPHLTQDAWNKAVALFGNSNGLSYSTSVDSSC